MSVPSRFLAPTAFQQHLGLWVELGPESTAVHLAARPDLCGADGQVALGVLATLADCAGGMFALRTIEPHWTATMTLSVHRIAPMRDARLVARPRLVRRRRTSLVIAVDILDGLDRPIAVSTGLFADLERSDTSGLEVAMRGARPLVADQVPGPLPGAAWPLLRDQIGIRTDRSGRSTLELHDGVRNTAHALIGGAMAVLVDTASMAAAAACADAHPVSTDLELHYLGPGRVGPVTAVAHVLGDEPSPLVSVTVVDAGAGGRALAEAVVRLGTADRTRMAHGAEDAARR